MVKKAPTFPAVLRRFEGWLKSYGIALNNQEYGHSFAIVTDGELQYKIDALWEHESFELLYLLDERETKPCVINYTSFVASVVFHKINSDVLFLFSLTGSYDMGHFLYKQCIVSNDFMHTVLFAL